MLEVFDEMRLVGVATGVGDLSPGDRFLLMNLLQDFVESQDSLIVLRSEPDIFLELIDEMLLSRGVALQQRVQPGLRCCLESGNEGD